MRISRSIVSVIEILLTLCNVINYSIGECIYATFGCTSHSYSTEKEERCQEENRLFSKSGQRQNVLDLEGKTARFIGQLLPHAHAKMDVLVLLSSLPLPVLER